MFHVFDKIFDKLSINSNNTTYVINESIINTDIITDPLKNGGEGPAMVLIPAGTFRMGDITGHGFDREQPVHKVSVESFLMGRYLVTFAEYDHFCKATKRKKPDANGWGRGNQPVINVSWHDAVAYTEWLTQQTNQTYRLPTEAEWEYAARAGTKTDYWWGNEIDETKANYGGKLGHTSPVGDYDPNPFGLYDMLGNVWEWTSSEYEAPYNGKEKVCISKKSNESRVLRGGSWSGSPTNLRTANRHWNAPGNRTVNYGFRVVRAAWT